VSSHVGFRAAEQHGIFGYEVAPTNHPETVKGFVYDSGGPDGWCATWGESRWVPGFKSREYAGKFLVGWRTTLERGLAE
jgi:hypothetical protein